MALDPKAALALIQEKQKAAAERDQTEQVTIAQIKDKLIKIEQLVKQGNQIDKNQEAKREELYRLTADLKTVIPKQTAFMDQVTMNAARIEDFLEVSFARVFTGLSSITNGMGVITNTIRTGFVGLKNSFMSISTNTINAVRGFVRNAWSNASRFLSLDIRQQLSNVMGLITGSITRVIGGAISLAVKGIKLAIGAVVGVIRTGLRIVTGAVLGALKLAWQGVSWAISKVWSLVSGLASMVFRFVYQSLLKIGSFILGFMWTTIKWVAGAIAGFLWDTVKSIAATVGKTFLYLTTQLVGTIVISIMAALGPYIALIGGIFLLVMYFTGQLNEWWNGLLGWFGMGSNKESPAQNADTSKGFWATLYGWVWGNENEQGWLKEGLTTLGDLLVRAFGLGQNLMEVVGRGWDVVEDWANRFVITPLTEFLQSTTFGRWIERTFNFLKEWFMETAIPWLTRYILGETEKNVRDDILSAQERLSQIRNQFGGGELATAREELERREMILANGIGNQARNQKMVEEARERVDSLQAERDQLRADLISSREKLDTNNFDQGLLSRIAGKLSSWWFGENGNWETPISGSPMAGILNSFFGDAGSWWKWGTNEGVIGSIKEFIINDVFNPLVRWFDMSIIPFLNNILRGLADILSKVGGDSLAQKIRETMGSLNRRRIESMSNMGMLSTFTDTDTIMSSFNQTDQDRGLIGRIAQMNIEDSERTTLDTARRALTNQMPSADIGISDIVNYIELNPQLMEDSAPMFDQTIRTMKGLFTQLVFASNPEYFGFDQTNRLAFSQRASNYFAQYGVEMPPNSYDTFLENIPSLLGDDFSVYTHDGYTSSFENFQTYEDVWSSMYGQEVVDVLRNMFQKSPDLGRYLRGIFNEIGNGDLEAGMNRYINPGGRDFFENLWADASVSSLATGGLGAAMIKSYFKTFSRDKGTFLNELGFGVGTMRQLLQRSISDADSAADEYFGFDKGGVALPFGGGVKAWIAEAGDPEMVIPLNSQGADFIIETMNRVNIGNSNSNLNEKLDSIDRKISGLTPSEARESPSTSLVEEYNPPVELPQDRKKFDFVKYMAMGMFEGNS